MTEMHTHDVAQGLRNTALNMLRNHGHDGYDDQLTRENCGACRLNGFDPTDDEGALQPGHAGWARVYVQAGLPIPKRFREAFEDERVSENHAYARGLALDIATFGVTYE